MIPSSPLDALRTVPMFSDFSRAELQVLAGHFVEVQFPEGDTIIEEGAANESFHAILEGHTEVRIGGHVVRTLGPGDFFGEISVHTGSAAAAAVVARAPVRALVMSGASYAALRANPVAAERITRAIEERIAYNRRTR